MTGVIYAVVIFLACVLGAIVGLGGGVFIRPILDAIGHHTVMEISFFSSTAILTMAIVSTIKRIKDGMEIKVKMAVLISSGAIVGGMLGNILLQRLIYIMASESNVQIVQIIATVAVLLASIFVTLKKDLHFQINNHGVLPFMGICLGIIGAFLGMGGGPLNVPLLMIFFGLPIKTATAYSIIIIFFTHSSRLVTLGVTDGFGGFDLSVLPFVIIAAAIGGFLGANLSRVFTEAIVKRLFICALVAVIGLNLFNGVRIWFF